MGMLAEQPGVPGSGIWDAQKVADFDFALCAAGISPAAAADELFLGTDWLGWGTYADDYYSAVFRRARNRTGARLQTERLKLFMPLSDTFETPEPANAVERGLADVWARSTATTGADARACLRRAVVEMTESWLWELENAALNKIPDPIDYLEMRRKTFGSELTTALTDLAAGDIVPEEFRNHEAIASLENSAADYACLINDVYSYQKEIEYEGDVHNLLLVVQNFFDCGYDEALGIVEDLMRLRLEQFQRAAEVELPRMYEDYGLDAVSRTALDGRAARLRDWIAAVLNWHRNVRRYREEDLQRHFGGPASSGPKPRAWELEYC